MKCLLCSFDRKIRGVNFILIDPQGNVLIQKRDENCKSFPHQYCFPGGGIEEGERLIEAVIREIDEEVGLPHHELLGLVEAFDFEYELDGQIYYNRFYVCQDVNRSSIVTPLIPEGEMIWLNYDELHSLTLILDEGEILDLLGL